jgi:CheY-like chemotaxis protein/DNA-binding XRE family transcriptional regulator
MSKKSKRRGQRPEAQVRLGAMVREFRHRLGLTQDELGFRSNLHRTYIADVERGARNVTLRSIINLAKALDVTVGRMLSHAADKGDTRAGEEDASAAHMADILLVDDNGAEAALAVRAFKRARVTNRLRIARDAEEALGMLDGAQGKLGPVRPGLILLNPILSGMSGVEFLRRIRMDRRTRDVPVVLIASAGRGKAFREYRRLGAANCIARPIEVESVVRLAPKLDLQLSLVSRAN